jgi:hypothetical protein
MFGKPVPSTNGHFREQNDLFWLRTQLFSDLRRLGAALI